MMGDGFLGATAAGFVSPNSNASVEGYILGQSRASVEASSIFFMVLVPDAFEVRRIVCVEN